MRTHDHDSEETSLRPKSARLDSQSRRPPAPGGRNRPDRRPGQRRDSRPAAGGREQRGRRDARGGTLAGARRGQLRRRQPARARCPEEMQGRLGHDFSDVRVHNDSTRPRIGAVGERARLHRWVERGVPARQVRPRFGRRQDDAGPRADARRPAAQRAGRRVVDSGGGIKVSDPSDRFEREASANAERVMAGPAPATQVGGAGAGGAACSGTRHRKRKPRRGRSCSGTRRRGGRGDRAGFVRPAGGGAGRGRGR